jgi:hypothetical protein
MSHYICKSLNIDVKAGKVWATGTDNNVFRFNPVTGRERREFRKSEWEYMSRLLREQGKAAVEEQIAMDVLDGNVKFYSGKFYKWRKWFCERVKDSPLREKTDYRYGREQGTGEWNLEAEKIRKELWREYCRRPPEPKKDYCVVSGDGCGYACRITAHRLYMGGVKTVFHAKKSELEARVKRFAGNWEVREA